jgi:DNA-binding transcriptional ArsR family regulator
VRHSGGLAAPRATLSADLQNEGLTSAWQSASITTLFHNVVVIEMQPTDLDAVFGALADPTRRAILARLTTGDRTVAEIAAPFAMSQPAISRHLKVLEGAGLITRTRRATARLSHLEATPLRDATEWLAKYQAWWDESHGRLDALLARLQADPNPGTAAGRSGAEPTE